MKCIVCGKEFTKRIYSQDICSDECFHFDFWNEIIRKKDKFIIVDGKCYHDSGNIENHSAYQSLGFDGRRFWIITNNGDKFTTNNLWFNGIIPNRFKESLPDNAKFVSCEEYEKM